MMSQGAREFFFWQGFDVWADGRNWMIRVLVVIWRACRTQPLVGTLSVFTINGKIRVIFFWFGFRDP